MDFITLSLTGARYLIEEGQRLLEIGYGDDDNGIVNEIPADTEAYAYVNGLLGFIRLVVGVIRFKYGEADDLINDDLLSIDEEEI